MNLAPAIFSALEALSGGSRAAAAIDATLRTLAMNLQRITPGVADVALLVIEDAEPVARRAVVGTGEGAFRSSLLVESASGPASVQLLVRGFCSDAFTQVAGQLAGLLAPMGGREPVVDLHLRVRSEPQGFGAQETPSPDPAAVNRAVGALLDRGRLPDEASRELDRLGIELALPVDEVARLFLRGLRRRDARGALQSS